MQSELRELRVQHYTLKEQHDDLKEKMKFFTKVIYGYSTIIINAMQGKRATANVVISAEQSKLCYCLRKYNHTPLFSLQESAVDFQEIEEALVLIKVSQLLNFY